MGSRRTRAGLPNFRPRRYSYVGEAGDGEFVLPDAKIAAIGVKHKVSQEQLSEALISWREDTVLGPGPPKSERKRLLRELARHAGEFAEVIWHVGDFERKLILEVLGPAFQPVPNDDRLSPSQRARQQQPYRWQVPTDRAWLQVETAFERLQSAAKAATSKVGMSRRGPKGRVNDIELLCRLYRIYRDAHGKAAGRVSNNLGIFGGRFFRFADEVLRECCGIAMENGSLGRAIGNAQKAVDKTDRSL